MQNFIGHDGVIAGRRRDGVEMRNATHGHGASNASSFSLVFPLITSVWINSPIHLSLADPFFPRTRCRKRVDAVVDGGTVATCIRGKIIRR